MMVIITIFTITMMSFIQRATPNHLIGKVISYILAIPQCTLPVGQAMYGFLFDVGMGHIDSIVYGTAFFQCFGCLLFQKSIQWIRIKESLPKSQQALCK
jgi:hypothetical protein